MIGQVTFRKKHLIDDSIEELTRTQVQPEL